MEDDETYNNMVREYEKYIAQANQIVGPLAKQKYPLRPSGTYSRPSVQETACFIHGGQGEH